MLATILNVCRSRGARLLACTLVAAFAALWSLDAVRLSPPGLQPRRITQAGASTHVLIDRPTSVVRNRHLSSDQFTSLAVRAALLGQLMTGAEVRADIARRAGVRPEDLSTLPVRIENVPAVLNEPDNERRAAQILAAQKPYRLQVQPDRTIPVLNIYTQAPTAEQARRLADAAAPALAAYLRREAVAAGVNPKRQVRLVQLGEARAAVLNGSAKKMLAVLAFAVAFALSWAATALPGRRRRGRPDAGAGADAELDPPPPGGDDDAPEKRRRREGALRLRWPSGAGVNGARLSPAVATAGAPPAAATLPRAVPRERTQLLPPARGRGKHARDWVSARAGDWPRTTRLLPWGLACFLAVVWLVPFNVIQLTISTPVDMKFDRIVLAPLLGLWVLTLIVGGPGRPRIRMTAIHGAILAFVALVGLSLVLDGPGLSQTLELDTSVKKLFLLASYFSFFVLAASSIRRTEINAFLTYTLILAVICAVGTIWEYRFQYNFFYALSDKFLPGIFSVGSAESSAVDDIGRRIVRGPAEVPLEAVTMMSMAFPIALTGVLRSKETRERVLYGIAACLLMAAVVSTFRKSAFLAPISVVLTLAYFRRRELLRLAPLALVLFVAIHVLSPGAFGSIASQLHGDRLNAVSTVSDRTSDYDAIRPDVWSHLAFGRGFGSYDHNTYRILDNELLGRLIEIGVLGLVGYIVMILSVTAVAVPSIRARGPDSHLALSVAATAICFLVVSMLFDVMSFPHCPYIFLFLAALLAVSLKPGAGTGVARPPDPREERWSS